MFNNESESHIKISEKKTHYLNIFLCNTVVSLVLNFLDVSLQQIMSTISICHKTPSIQLKWIMKTRQDSTFKDTVQCFQN